MKTEHVLDLTRCSHGLDIGFRCWNCTIEELMDVEMMTLARKHCRGCGRPVVASVDYCAECTSEDERDCW
jgi:hypothetical protein